MQAKEDKNMIQIQDKVYDVYESGDSFTIRKWEVYTLNYNIERGWIEVGLNYYGSKEQEIYSHGRLKTNKFFMSEEEAEKARIKKVNARIKELSYRIKNLTIDK